MKVEYKKALACELDDIFSPDSQHLTKARRWFDCSERVWSHPAQVARQHGRITIC
jgi:hypothetical protein